MAGKRNAGMPLADGPDVFGVPEPPAGLRAAGAAIWRTVWVQRQVLASDALTVARLCRLEDEAASLRAALDVDGPIQKRPQQSARGEVIGVEYVAHPALASLRRIGAEAARLCDALGLSPAGRSELGLPVLTDPEPPDAADRLRARREAGVTVRGAA